MATITRTGPPDNDGGDFTQKPKFRALIQKIKLNGSSNLNHGDRLSIAELARQKEIHSDPRVRKQLQEAYNQVSIAHLEYCLKIPQFPPQSK